MKARTAAVAAILFVTVFVAGCAQDGAMTTGALNTSSLNKDAALASTADPSCATLAAQIETLHKDGIADKVSQAAAKKYWLKPTDLAKADELNKANAQFQAKCATVPSKSQTASKTPAKTSSPKKVNKTASKPPVPAQKTVATAAVAPAETTTVVPKTTTATPSPQP